MALGDGSIPSVLTMAWAGAARLGLPWFGSAGLGTAGHGCKRTNKEMERTMDSYKITITGTSALLMHRDNIEFADDLKLWRQQPENKKLSVAGDDRSPAFTWLGCVYEDEGNIAIPSDNLMRCLMEGGAMVPVPGGKNGKTFKAQTQSGMLPHETGWALLIDDAPIAMDEILPLREERDFKVHVETVKDLGFVLFTKRAKIGTSKHVRVRPKFPRWSLSGRLDVWDDQITKEVLVSVLRSAGEFKGLGDWRPSSKTPGPYGRFTAEVDKL